MDFKAFRERIKSSQPKKWSDRQRLLNARDLALDGKLYDHIANPFTREFKNDHSDERISLDDRRAAVQYRLPLIITRGFVNMLFGEGRRPVPYVRNDDVTNAWIMAFLKDTRAWWHLYSAAYQGQTGSVAIVLRVLAENTFHSSDPQAAQSGPGQFHLEVWPAVECEPVFKPWAPTDLHSLQRTYFVRVDTLRARDYDVETLERKWQERRYGRSAAGTRLRALAEQNTASEWWAMRLRLERSGEVWYEPIPKWLYDSEDFNDRKEWPIDGERSFDHNLGETCALWVINAPDRESSFPDGLCTFEPAIDFEFRIDRTLSQTGRAFDYAGDPQLAKSEGPISATGDGGGNWDGPEGPTGATSTDVIDLGPGGKAEFIEITGEGLKIAIDTYCRELRMIARELCAASRIDPENSGRELSGVAMMRLNEAMVGFLGVLKLAYGDGALEPLLRLGMRLFTKVKVHLPSFEGMLADLLDRRAASEAARAQVQQMREQRSTDSPHADDTDDAASGEAPAVAPKPKINPANARPNPNAYIETKWPHPYPMSGAEKQSEVSAAVSGRDGKVIAQETAVASVAGVFDVLNPDQELSDIHVESIAAEERELAMVAQNAKIQASYTVTPE